MSHIWRGHVRHTHVYTLSRASIVLACRSASFFSRASRNSLITASFSFILLLACFLSLSRAFWAGLQNISIGSQCSILDYLSAPYTHRGHMSYSCGCHESFVWVTWLIRVCAVTRFGFFRVMSRIIHINVSRMSLMNESRMSRTNEPRLSCVPRMNDSLADTQGESLCTHEWIMLLKWIIHVTHTYSH